MIRFEQIFPSYHYVLLSLFLLGGLEIVFAFPHYILLLSIVLVFLIATGIALIKSEEGTRFDITHTILPVLMTTGFVSFALFLPASAWLHLYFAGAAIFFYFLLKNGSRTAYPTWNWVLSMLVFFLNITSILGWRFHLYTPVVLILVVLAIISCLILWQALRRATYRSTEALFIAAGMAFALTELAWALQFLPLHYIAQASILTAVYYTSFNLVSISLMRALNKKDVAEYTSVGLGAFFIIVLTARWI